MKSFLNWLDNRTGYRSLLHEALYERVPGGARWRYVWGSTLVAVFMVQVVTGFVLWMGYSPSAQTAWESVFYIQNQMTLGWLVRGIHHFAAQAMVVLMVIHLMQVIIDGAYRAPREINFWTGLILMQIVLGLGLTGYLLPWDQKGYYATEVATNIMGHVPVVGKQVQQLVIGGSNYGHHTLTRFFAMHAGVLPAAMVGFLAFHIYVFRRQGLTVKQPPRKPDTTFWPDQVLMDAVACLAVVATVMVLAVWKGSELSAPADPSEGYSAARPEWYYLFLFRFLKIPAVAAMGEAVAAIYIPGALMLILALMPLIAKVRGGHKFNVAYAWLVLVFAGGLTGIALYEDWWQNDDDSRDFRAAVAKAHREGERTMELAKEGIPVSGALSLLRDDPLTQGPKLFATRCASCHRWNGHDGQGNVVMEGKNAAPQTAPDLAKFASREWLRSVLTDFPNHFSSLSKATVNAEKAATILNGQMEEWSKVNGPMLLQAENHTAADALIEFLYAQSGRRDAIPGTDPLYAAGQEVFAKGKLPEGSFDKTCVDCHSMTTRENVELSSELQPVLTGYGGGAWLKQMIMSPDSHYGEGNAMPSFADQLTGKELDLLVRWMTGDYLPTELPQPTLPVAK